MAAAGATLSLASGQDINLTAQGHMAAHAKQGLVLYTAGQASDAGKPNQETGLKLHAASGAVSVQAQGGALHINAQQALTLDSTQASITLTAPNRILLVGAGSALEINGANITLTTSGPGTVHAASKVLAGGVSALTPGLEFANSALHLPPSKLCVDYVDAYGEAAPGQALQLKSERGATHTVASGSTEIPNFKKSLVSLKTGQS